MIVILIKTAVCLLILSYPLYMVIHIIRVDRFYRKHAKERKDLELKMELAAKKGNKTLFTVYFLALIKHNKKLEDRLNEKLSN